MVVCGVQEKHRKVVVAACVEVCCSIGGNDRAYDVEEKHPRGGALRELLLKGREVLVTMEREGAAVLLSMLT